MRRHFWIDMRFVAQICLIWSVLFVTAHHLPAPIVEEKPTPAPEKSAKPKPKRPTNSNSNQNSERSTTRKTNLPPQTQSTPNPRPFAGTWIEKNKGAAGITIVVSPTQDWAVAKNAGGIWGDRGGRAVVEGNTLSWKFMVDKWVMVIAPDGKTAGVTGYGWPGTFRGTFEKVP